MINTVATVTSDTKIDESDAGDASDATHPTSSRRQEKQQKIKSVDEMFNPEPLCFDALNLRDGPHQLVGEMYHTDVCYRCKQTCQIAWYYSDFNGKKHDLCTECGWAVSKELKKRHGGS